MALPDCGDAIDPSTFEQILEMDDDEEREFSKSIVFGFFEQASNTFEEMQTKLCVLCNLLYKSTLTLRIIGMRRR